MRPRGRTWSLLAVVAATGAPGCGGESVERTEIVVVVDSDLRCLAQMDRVELDLMGSAEGATAGEDLDGLDPPGFPFTLGIRPRAVDDAPVEVTARGLLNGVVVVRSTVRTRFVPGHRRVLRMWLLSSCQESPECMVESRCEPDGCAQADVLAESLEPFDGTVGATIDAGVLDCSEVCVPQDEVPLGCNGVDDDCDGDVDEDVRPNDPDNCGRCGYRCETGSCLENLVCDIDEMSRVAAGRAHSCGLTDGGRLFCWGANDRGQLGITGTAPRPAATSVVREGVERVWAGGDYTCVRRDGSTISCWGQLEGTASPTGLSGAVDLDIGPRHACALVGPELRCWGANDVGQIDAAAPEDVDEPMPVASPTGYGAARAAAVGRHHTCAVYEPSPPTTNAAVFCWGANDRGQIDASRTDEPRLTATPIPGVVPPVTGIADRTIIDAGDAHTCALSASDDVWCWGANDRWQAAGEDRSAGAVGPTMVGAGGSPWDSVATGSHHSCARSSAQAVVLCWGDNLSKQAGGGDSDGPTSTGTAVFGGSPPMMLRGVARLALGARHGCMLPEGEEATLPRLAACWGDGRTGQLGSGTLLDAGRAVAQTIAWPPQPVP